MIIQVHGIAAVNGRGQVLMMEIEVVEQITCWHSLEKFLKNFRETSPPLPGIYKILLTYDPAGKHIDIDYRTQLCELRNSELWSGENKL